MRRQTDPVDKALHRKIGTYLFNHTWSLLERKRRSPGQNHEMLSAAHASLYHWSRGGGQRNRCIAEWQVSRVYSVLGRPEPALHHGQRALEIARHGRVAPFYVAYAYEALARAAAVAGQRRARALYLRKAERIGKTVRDSQERKLLMDDLATIP